MLYMVYMSYQSLYLVFLSLVSGISWILLSVGIMSVDILLGVQSWTSYRCGDEKKRRVQAIMESLDQKVLIQACKETVGIAILISAVSYSPTGQWELEISFMKLDLVT